MIISIITPYYQKRPPHRFEQAWLMPWQSFTALFLHWSQLSLARIPLGPAINNVISERSSSDNREGKEITVRLNRQKFKKTANISTEPTERLPKQHHRISSTEGKVKMTDHLSLTLPVRWKGGVDLIKGSLELRNLTKLRSFSEDDGHGSENVIL